MGVGSNEGEGYFNSFLRSVWVTPSDRTCNVKAVVSQGPSGLPPTQGQEVKELPPLKPSHSGAAGEQGPQVCSRPDTAGLSATRRHRQREQRGPFSVPARSWGCGACCVRPQRGPPPRPTGAQVKPFSVGKGSYRPGLRCGRRPPSRLSVCGHSPLPTRAHGAPATPRVILRRQLFLWPKLCRLSPRALCWPGVGGGASSLRVGGGVGPHRPGTGGISLGQDGARGLEARPPQDPQGRLGVKR